jgi:hypothetical protein
MPMLKGETAQMALERLEKELADAGRRADVLREALRELAVDSKARARRGLPTRAGPIQRAEAALAEKQNLPI